MCSLVLSDKFPLLHLIQQRFLAKCATAIPLTSCLSKGRWQYEVQLKVALNCFTNAVTIPTPPPRFSTETRSDLLVYTYGPGPAV